MDSKQLKISTVLCTVVLLVYWFYPRAEKKVRYDEFFDDDVVSELSEDQSFESDITSEYEYDKQGHKKKQKEKIVKAIEVKEKKKKRKKKSLFNNIKVAENIKGQRSSDEGVEEIDHMAAYGVALNMYKKIEQDKSNLGEKKQDPLVKDSLNNRLPDNVNGIVAILNKSSDEAFIAEEALKFSLEIFNNKKKIIAEQITASVYSPSGEKKQELIFKKDNALTYRASYEAGSEANVELGRYLVKYSISANNTTLYKIDTFSLEARVAKFGKQIRSSRTSGGDLLIKPMFRVHQKGTYLVQGTLYDRFDKPLAYKEVVKELGRRKRNWVRITFPGSVFYNKKMDGPYTLKNLRISFVDQDLTIIKQEQSEPMYQTAKYRWDEFNSKSLANSSDRQKIELLEAITSQL